MGCVLHVTGREFASREFARRTTLPVHSVHVKGEPRFPQTDPKGKRWLRSGIGVVVSDAAFTDLRGQIRDALRFLARHKSALQRLGKRADVDEMTLDFSVQRRDAAVELDRFPHELLLAAGRLRIDIEVSSC